MEQIRSGEILFKANLKKQEEKKKLKKLKKEQSLQAQDRKIGSMCLLFIHTLFSLYLLSWPLRFLYIFIMLAVRSSDNSDTEAEGEDKA